MPVSQLIAKCLFFLSLVILSPLSYAQDLKESFAKADDIKLLDESGKEVNASIEDIRASLLRGKLVRFSENQAEEKRRMASEWIAEALRLGVEKIHVSNAILTGDLNLSEGARLVPLEESGLNPERMEKLKDITSIKNVYLAPASISITDCRVEGSLTAGADLVGSNGVVVFQDDVNFSSTTFMEEADFTYASFRDSAYFLGTSFLHEADFYGTDFQGQANFLKTSFGKANFGHASFHDRADFKEAHFKEGGASFMMVNFQDVVFFNGANFLGNVNFHEATFKDEAIFFRASFHRNIDLRLANYSKLRISWPQLIGSYSPLRGVFGPEPGGRLDGTLLNHEGPGKGLLVVLEEAKREKKPLKKLLEKEDALRMTLNLENFVLWREVYVRLIKNFEDIGDTDSADDAYYHYKCIAPKFKTTRLESDPGEEYIIGRGWQEKTMEGSEYVFVRLTCGYGVRPLRPLAVTGILILIFTLVYFCFMEEGYIEYKHGRKPQRWYHKLYNSLVFSGMVFTTFGYGDFSPKRALIMVTIMEVTLGWLTMSLFLITLGHVWMR